MSSLASVYGHKCIHLQMGIFYIIVLRCLQLVLSVLLDLRDPQVRQGHLDLRACQETTSWDHQELLVHPGLEDPSDRLVRYNFLIFV